MLPLKVKGKAEEVIKLCALLHMQTMKEKPVGGGMGPYLSPALHHTTIDQYRVLHLTHLVGAFFKRPSSTQLTKSRKKANEHFDQRADFGLVYAKCRIVKGMLGNARCPLGLGAACCATWFSRPRWYRAWLADSWIGKRTR